MNADYERSYPWTWEREVASPAAQVYEETAQRLRGAGFSLRDAQPPEAAAEAERFDGKFMAKRDVVLDARKRRVGKIAFGVGVVLTIVLLIMLAEGIGAERGIISTPLLVAVILGGFGMNRLREPEQRVRKLIEVSVMGAVGGGARLIARGGSGPAFGDDWVEQWADEQDFEDEEAVLTGVGARLATEAQA